MTDTITLTPADAENLIEQTTEVEVTVEPPKYSRGFWVDLADRSISSAAGAALALATATSFNLLEPDLPGILAVVGTAAAVSILKALAVEAKANKK